MNYSFQYDGIDFEVELEKVLKPYQPQFDDEDWQAFLKGDLAIYHIHIISSKGERKLSYFHSGQPMSTDLKEQKEELECLFLDTALFDPIFTHWKLEESPQSSPPWSK